MEQERLAKFESLLKTSVIGRQSQPANQYLAEVDSTSTRATQLARQGADEGVVVIARHQTSGRGRRGRVWESPPDSGLLMSLLLRPKKSVSELPVITLCLGVATARAVFAITGVELGLKWVNDLIYDGKKAGGILAEMPIVRPAPTDNRVALVIGVGINLKPGQETPPEEIRERAIWLEDVTGYPVETELLAAELCYQIEQYYDRILAGDSAGILDEWRSMSVTLGRQIVCTTANSSIEGEALDLAATGALIVRTREGTREIHAAEVSIRNQDGSYC